MTKTRAQSAIEYLTTYGWAILIIAVVIIALFRLGLFNPAGNLSTTCIFPADFACLSSVLYSSNSTLAFNLQQEVQSTIVITAYGCNNQGLASNMITPANQITLGIGDNVTFNVQCYQNGTVATLRPTQLYTGFVIVNYTNVQSGFKHTVVGTLRAKAV